MTEPAFTCPIVIGGKTCGALIPERHWACRSCWLRFPRPFVCASNRHKRGTPEYESMIERANMLAIGADWGW
jgi:hypothetical protein